MNRDQLARQFNVSKRGIANAVFVLNNGTPEIIAQVEAGKINLQEAMRMLGKTTQRERNRRRVRQTLELCEAVLNGEQHEAEILAAQIILRVAHTRAAKGDCDAPTNNGDG